MTTKIGILKGLKEQESYTFEKGETLEDVLYRPVYFEKEVEITRFWGGKERGVSIRLDLENDYIQLDNASAKEIANKILESLAEFDKIGI